MRKRRRWLAEFNANGTISNAQSGPYLDVSGNAVANAQISSGRGGNP